MGMAFLEKYKAAKKGHDSVLCVGLDPASIFFKDADSIPRKYFEKNSEVEGMLEFCLDVVEKTSDHAVAFKPNAQFVFPFSLAQLQKLNKKISDAGCVSIFDLKLSDIGSSNESAVYWMKKAGFDAFTFSPFAGNIEEATKTAHKNNLGIFVLALMSNSEAKYFMRDGMVEGKKGYQWISEQVAKCDSDGVVVGATNEGTEMQEIRGIISPDKIILIPGIGKQGGELNVLKQAGVNVLVNVGRSLIYSDDPAKSAEEYKRQFNEALPSR